MDKNAFFLAVYQMTNKLKETPVLYDCDLYQSTIRFLFFLLFLGSQE